MLCRLDVVFWKALLPALVKNPYEVIHDLRGMANRTGIKKWTPAPKISVGADGILLVIYKAAPGLMHVEPCTFVREEDGVFYIKIPDSLANDPNLRISVDPEFVRRYEEYKLNASKLPHEEC
jgi:hypothetical protein